MKRNLFSFYFFFCNFYFSIFDFVDNQKLIISLSSKFKNLEKTKMIIESILNQNCHPSSYKIILILSKKEIKDFNNLPKSILLLKKYIFLKTIFL